MASSSNPLAAGSLGLDQLHAARDGGGGGGGGGSSGLSHEQRLKAARENDDPISVNSQSTNASAEKTGHGNESGCRQRTPQQRRGD